ncbi:tape measure protein, partial [Candidatus Pacearchaeota archaeon]|jgi:tape measure domain-containing protein|nr:tape measure protein [Candidatus Pacearchaeota archaeon]
MVEEVSSSTREFVKLEERIEKLEDSLKRSAASVGNMNQNLAQSAQASDLAGIKLTALGYSLSQIGSTLRGLGGGLGSEMLGAAKDFEKTSISLRALVGDTEKADKLLRDMTSFAAKTPFEMPTLLGATKMLMQYGTKVEDVLPILKSIGDVTGGVDAQKVMQMSYAFGQMSSSGRLMGQDLLQMINAGFNPLGEIAKKTGKSVAELKKEMESGRITVNMVKEAFAQASGRLDLMTKQSKSLEGLQSTLNDNVGIFKRKLGDELVPTMKAFVDWQGRMTSSFDGLGASSKAAIAYTAGAVEVLGIGTEKLSSVAMTLAALKLSGMGAMMWSVVPATIAAGAATVTWLNSIHSVVGVTKMMTGSAIATAVTWRVGVYGAIVAVTLAILDAASAQDKLNEAFAKGELLSGKFRRFETQQHEAAMQLPAGATEFQKTEVYKKEADRLSGKVKSRQQNIGQKEARLTQMEGSFEESWLWGGANIKQLQKEIQNDRAELEHLQSMAAEVAKLLNPTKDNTAAGAEVLKSLKLRDEAIGKTAIETKILEYANKGLSQSELDLAKQREPQILAKEMIHKLEEETAQYGMSEKELEKYKLEMSGLPPLLRDAVQSHMDLRDAAKKEAEARSLAEKQTAETEAAVRKTIEAHKEEAEVLAAGSKEQWLLNKAMKEGLEISQAAALADVIASKEAEAQRKLKETKAQEEKTKSLNEGKNLMEKYLTAQQKFEIREKRLAELLEMSAITQSVFNEELEAAREELDKLQNKNISVKFDVKGVDAVAAGSAEAMWRIAEFESGRGQAAAIARGARRGPASNFRSQKQMIANVDRWSARTAKEQGLAPMPVPSGELSDPTDETTVVLKEIRDLNKRLLDKDPLEGVELSNASSGGGL